MNRKKRAYRIFKIAEWTIFATVPIILSLAYYLVHPVRCEKVLYLPSGSGATIIAYLKKRGFDVNGLDRSMLRFFGYPQQGWIEMGANRLSKGDFLYRLTHAKAAMTRIVLIPGETQELFLDQVAKKLHLNRVELERLYARYSPYPDGVIWPDTYYIPVNISAEQLVRYLIHRSLRRHEELSKKFFGVYNETRWFRYVTIASIIQKEAADEEEMPIIAGVIYNRLKRKMPLQMDGTLNYGRYSHTKVTRRRIEEDTSLFNTYRHKGLPPWPVGSVSLAALKAAIKPAKTDYLYFVKGRDGRHIFTKRYSSHLRAVKSVNK